MCGGMKFVDLSKILTNDELTEIIELVKDEQANQNHYLRDTRIATSTDYEIQKSIERLEVILQKLENVRSG